MLKIEQGPHANVHNVYFEKVRAKWKQRIFFCSDIHWDSKKCRRDMLKKHFEHCKANDIPIFIFGDMFDLMQGRNDRRSNKGALRGEFNSTAHFTAIAKQAVEWFKPYAHLIQLIGDGNHETAVLRNNEFDFIDLFIILIKMETGHDIKRGYYKGYLRFLFNEDKRGKGKAWLKTLRYHHGAGGGGPVTKGVIQAQRRQVYLEGVDIVMQGHIHESWETEIPSEYLNKQGQIKQRVTKHIQLPSYKQDITGHSGWAVEKDFAPQPVGGKEIVFYQQNKEIHTQTLRAGDGIFF